MGTSAEPAKGLLPYLQRADELQNHEPLVAYYCRLYAMEKGLVIPPKDRTKMTNSVLVSLINQLEKDKKSLTLGPDDNLHLEGFASSVFAKADKQDRAGRADINTAKTFYAASIFFEILSQFGELQPDLEQKQKYAIWKAAQIRKALKEGRQLEAGPPGGDNVEASASSTTNAHDMERSQSFNSQNGNGTPSQPIDKDFNRRDSFSAAQPGNVSSRESADKFNDHVSAQAHFSSPPPLPSEFSSPQSQFSPPPHSSYSSHSYEGTDYPPRDVHKQHPNYSSPSYTSTDYPTNEVYKPPSSYSPPPYSRTYYPLDEGYNPQSNENPDVSAYAHTYQQPPCTVEPQHTSQNYNTTETPYHQSSKVTAAPPASQCAHDSSYQPDVDKIAEAHKAAKFAAGALAVDDVSIAVEHLKRALDLLTNPSTETH